MAEQQAVKHNAKILINRQEYAMTLTTEEEELYRKAASVVNTKLARYEEHFPGQGTEKYKAYVMLDLASEGLLLRERHDTAPFMESMEKLTEEIEAVLGQK